MQADPVASFVSAHSTTIAVVAAYYIMSAAIGSMPAPTAQSKPLYLFFFKFLNTLAANLTRAYSTAVEASPNFAAAAIKANGAPKP